MNNIILDIEATGVFGKQKCYDLGGVVVDKDFHIIDSFNFVIEDIFFNSSMMRNAYYADKLPAYYNDLMAGRRTLATFAEARQTVLAMIKVYNVKKLWAYNACYDEQGLNYTSNLLLGRNFIPENMNVSFHCIMGAFLSTCAKTKRYINFAEKTDSGNVRVNAENAYRYFSGLIDFEEEHTGLADAIIEAEILKHCLKRHKKMDTEPKPLQSFADYRELQKMYRNM